jgi:wyosine [tRNA(Phe)-imidazoG37] synthetase (radical SAM superfamily)
VLLSNATGLVRPEVREALSVIDVPVLKLDAGTREGMVAVNRPARGIRFEEIVDDLVAVRGLTLQTLLVDGTPCNTTPGELEAYFDLVRLIAPEEVQLYSIDRPVPDDRISKVPEELLRQIAREGQDRTGVPFRVYAA